MTRHAFMMIVLGTLMMFGPISIDMYLPSMPTIARDFEVAGGSVQLTLSALVFGLAVGQLVYGPLSDRFGRLAPLTSGILLFGAASLGCAIASSVEAMAVLRLLQGIGGAPPAACWRVRSCAIFTTATTAPGFFLCSTW